MADVGRPTVMTEEVIRKLEQALMHGAPIVSACEIAGITTPTYYDHLNKDPAFSSKMESAQMYPDKVAKMNLVMALERESKSGGRQVDTSKWWAERRLKAEFSTRSELTGADGKDLAPAPMLGGKTADAVPNNNSDKQTT